MLWNLRLANISSGCAPWLLQLGGQASWVLYPTQSLMCPSKTGSLHGYYTFTAWMGILGIVYLFLLPHYGLSSNAGIIWFSTVSHLIVKFYAPLRTKSCSNMSPFLPGPYPVLGFWKKVRDHQGSSWSILGLLFLGSPAAYPSGLFMGRYLTFGGCCLGG